MPWLTSHVCFAWQLYTRILKPCDVIAATRTRCSLVYPVEVEMHWKWRWAHCATHGFVFNLVHQKWRCTGNGDELTVQLIGSAQAWCNVDFLWWSLNGCSCKRALGSWAVLWGLWLVHTGQPCCPTGGFYVLCIGLARMYVVYSVHTVVLAGISPNISSHTVCTYGSGQH